MPKLVATLLVVVLGIAACGDSGSGGFSSCDDVAQGGVDLLQDILDEVSDMTMDEFFDAANQETPEFVAKFEADADKLDVAQAELGCSDQELSDYVVDKLDTLSASGTVGELMLEAILSDPSAFEFGG